jgi:hypothetical protein
MAWVERARGTLARGFSFPEGGAGFTVPPTGQNAPPETTHCRLHFLKGVHGTRHQWVTANLEYMDRNKYVIVAVLVFLTMLGEKRY